MSHWVHDCSERAHHGRSTCRGRLSWGRPTTWRPRSWCSLRRATISLQVSSHPQPHSAMSHCGHPLLCICFHAPTRQGALSALMPAAPLCASGMVREVQAWRQALHAHVYTHLADIWSFGMVLLELARGKVPLAGCSFTKIILDTVHGDAPSLQTCGCTHRYSKVSALLPFDRASAHHRHHVLGCSTSPCAVLLS